MSPWLGCSNRQDSRSFMTRSGSSEYTCRGHRYPTGRLLLQLGGLPRTIRWIRADLALGQGKLPSRLQLFFRHSEPMEEYQNSSDPWKTFHGWNCNKLITKNTTDITAHKSRSALTYLHIPAGLREGEGGLPPLQARAGTPQGARGAGGAGVCSAS